MRILFLLAEAIPAHFRITMGVAKIMCATPLGAFARLVHKPEKDAKITYSRAEIVSFVGGSTNR